MREPWEQAPADAAVLLAPFRRDGFLLLSGAIAGAAATLFAWVPLAIAGVLVGRGPLAFFREIARSLLDRGTGQAVGLVLLAAAFGLVLVVGTGVGVVFALAADRLAHRDSILGLAVGFGLALFGILVAAFQVYQVPWTLPLGVLFVGAIYYGLALVVQQACMDVFEGQALGRPGSHGDEGPVRLPVLGRT